MTVSPLGQGRVFALYILFGIGSVILFDFFWVLRHKYAKSIIAENLLDCIYFIIIFFAVLSLGAKFNFGALRYYQIFGMMLGIIIQAPFSRMTRKLLGKLYNAFLKAAEALAVFFIRPCLFIVRIIMSPLYFFEDKIIKLGKRATKKYKKVKLKREKKKKTVKKRIKMI